MPDDHDVPVVAAPSVDDLPPAGVAPSSRFDGAFDGVCLLPLVDGGGPGGRRCGYVTAGWPSREVAAARVRQHLREHATGEPMDLMSVFMAAHGLAVDGEGRAVFAVPDGFEPVEG